MHGYCNILRTQITFISETKCFPSTSYCLLWKQGHSMKCFVQHPPSFTALTPDSPSQGISSTTCSKVLEPLSHSVTSKTGRLRWLSLYQLATAKVCISSGCAAKTSLLEGHSPMQGLPGVLLTSPHQAVCQACHGSITAQHVGGWLCSATFRCQQAVLHKFSHCLKWL